MRAVVEVLDLTSVERDFRTSRYCVGVLCRTLWNAYFPNLSIDESV